MPVEKAMNTSSGNDQLIAPCGMNCGICRAHLRPNKPCPGCRLIGPDHPKTRVLCQLRLCERRTGTFCYSCLEFPCDRLKRLDNRYRARFGMSEIENLEYIRDNGLDSFIEKEYRRWVTDAGVLCVHDKKIYPLCMTKAVKKKEE
jgi:hypothetical protein